MPDSWDVELEKGESSNDTDRNRTDSNCLNSVHGGKTSRSKITNLESQRIRRKWRLQQQLMESHQRKKEMLIKKYEIQRKHKLKQSTGGICLFKEPEGTQINSTELRKIKVDIYRNIPGKSAANELQRDIVNPEDVVVKRRAGEGVKPIFEREELKRAESNAAEVKEHHIVSTVKDANLENKPQASKRRSVSLSPTKNRSHSPRPTSSRHSRHEDYKQGDRENRRNNSNRGRSRERKEDRRRTQSCHVGDEETRLKERKNRRDCSRSKERDRAKWDRDSRHRKSIRGRSREERMPSQQIPIPIYYGNFAPRSVMVRPLFPFRGHVAFGGSRYPMWPMRPFGPRFPPRIDIYRLRPPGNTRGFRAQY